MSVYFIFGEDTYRVSLRIGQLLGTLPHKKLVRPVHDDDLEAVVLSMDLLSPEKLALFDLDQFSSAKNKLAAFVEQLAEQTDEGSLPEGLDVVFCLRGKPDQRLKYIKSIEKLASKYSKSNVIHIEPFKPWESSKIQTWVQEHIATHLPEIRADGEALRCLVDFFAGDIGLIISELTKLQLYVGIGQTISSQHVRETCTAQYSTISVVDMILRKDLSTATKSIQSICLDESPLPLIRGMQTMLSNYLHIADLTRQKKKSADIAKLIGGNPYKIDLDQKKIKNTSYDFLAGVLAGLNTAEEQIKNGSAGDPVVCLRFQILRSGCIS